MDISPPWAWFHLGIEGRSEHAWRIPPFIKLRGVEHCLPGVKFTIRLENQSEWNASLDHRSSGVKFIICSKGQNPYYLLIEEGASRQVNGNFTLRQNVLYKWLQVGMNFPLRLNNIHLANFSTSLPRHYFHSARMYGQVTTSRHESFHLATSPFFHPAKRSFGWIDAA